ncbi:MAG: alanine racemase [Armatimonadota bacterium]|nr:alanine racemase [Armatimonadota bacterium]MDR7503005.1 alanine racemase [Armatimonadota bacterium]MDR7526673.1 alanine racemase [Armatimonadota bacterium]MDR7575427.1 alanine racemase [Armatimonadota bacterium]MDR7586334.1 alanine racemase [Armatimonadota bacterium]
MTGGSTRTVPVLHARAWAEVDLEAVAANVQAVRRHVGATPVMAVVKANGYGHGALPVARAAVRAGAAWLGVATVEEGIALRDGGVVAPVLVLGPDEPVEEAVARGLTLTVADPASLHRTVTAARRASPGGRRVRVHLKVDTGMTRLGFWPEAVPAAVETLAAAGVAVEGVFTHLAAADSDPAFTAEQLRRFAPAARAVRARFPRALRHAAATAALLTVPEARLDLVRLGIGLYGLLPGPGFASPVALRPAMRLWARVAQVREVPAGVDVSYGRTYRTTGPTRLATVAIGYGDGYLRSLSNRGAMLLDGRRAPVVGRVCMDYTIVAVPPGAAVQPGDAALVFGPELPAEEVAEAAGTIAYEVVTRLGPRVRRIYRPAGEGGGA